MAITILLEMAVPARREPIITFFVLFRNSSDKRFGRPIFFKFWLFPLFLIDAFQKFMDVRLNVYFGYCFENLARTSLVLWAKTYFQPPYEYVLVYCCKTLSRSWRFYFIHKHLNIHSVYVFCCGGNHFCIGIFLFSSGSIRTSFSTFKVCSEICFGWHFYQKGQTLIDEIVITLFISNVFCFSNLFCSNY